jgi:glucose-6-phosphate dehydrogenase assembly protein OpcA
VAQHLTDLRQAAADEGGFPLARASVMNLIVYAGSARHAESAARIADELIMRHPSRVIVLAARRGPRFKLDAEVTVHSHPLASHGLVFERVLLRAAGAHPEGLDTLVIPLLIPHLQSYLWWMEDPDPDNAAMRSVMYICDRLVVDTAMGQATRLASLSSHFTGAAAAERGSQVWSRLVLGDLNWTRLTVFRDALASIFDEGHRAEYLDELESLELTGVRAGREPVSAAEILFAAWLTSRVGLSAPEPIRGGVTLAGAHNNRVSVTFRAREARKTGVTAPALFGFRLRAKRGSRHIEVSLQLRRGEGYVTLQESGQAPTHRTVPLALLSDSEVLSRELDRIGKDRVFEDSLLAAARMSAAIAGA